MKRFWMVMVPLLAVIAGGLWFMWPRSQHGLVLYSAVDYGPEVAKAFTRATGIPVTATRLSTGALLARISAEGKRPAWSVAWFDGNEAAAALDRAGLLARHVVPSLPWNELGKRLLPEDGSYTPTGLTLAGAFTFDSKQLANPPGSWADLTRPGLKDAIGMNNPAISGPMYPMLAGMLSQGGGWPQGKTFVMALKNNGLRVYPKNTNTLAALESGDIKLAVTQSSAAWYRAAGDPSLKVIVPKPSFALPSVMVISADAPPDIKKKAERFIRFAMSKKIQEMRIKKGEADGYYWPLTTDAPAPIKALPALDSLQVKILDPNVWGPLEPTVNQWFSEAVVGQ